MTEAMETFVGRHSFSFRGYIMLNDGERDEWGWLPGTRKWFRTESTKQFEALRRAAMAGTVRVYYEDGFLPVIRAWEHVDDTPVPEQES